MIQDQPPQQTKTGSLSSEGLGGCEVLSLQSRPLSSHLLENQELMVSDPMSAPGHM